MDPIAVTTLTALAGGAGGEAGRQVWQGLVALVRRPFRQGADDGDENATLSSGRTELTALQDAPGDLTRAAALAAALGVRAALDAEFRGLLTEWQQQAQAIRTAGSVHNEISGGTQHTVLQGQDFSHLTFTVSPTTPPTS
ncbi:hypothetical protein GO001_32875 [Streptomyces sp. NRRL B-1677]|uniref:Uncharacterized protein n=1 Tax=Streptomyces klenkii TaxID=1420899 RepID=A0A3B0BHJ9_9ACTN|nr:MULTISPECIES: hypothetical protein [Streptomyces]MBF6049924.1 hypothetical protein [Streptomyces sp. NRRL B-1677]RKN71719.1 hypothetical protein D7231_17190 [Streptomyces klenkii]